MGLYWGGRSSIIFLHLYSMQRDAHTQPEGATRAEGQPANEYGTGASSNGGESDAEREYCGQCGAEVEGYHVCEAFTQEEGSEDE